MPLSDTDIHIIEAMRIDQITLRGISNLIPWATFIAVADAYLDGRFSVVIAAHLEKEVLDPQRLMALTLQRLVQSRGAEIHAINQLITVIEELRQTILAGRAARSATRQSIDATKT